MQDKSGRDSDVSLPETGNSITQAQVTKEDASNTNLALVERINRSDRWMIALTAVIALAGLASAGIFGWQLNIMSGQLDEMKFESRPWIAVTSFGLVNPDDPVEPLKTRITYQNVGRIPATNVRNWLNPGYLIKPTLPPGRWNELPTWREGTAFVPSHICEGVMGSPSKTVVYPSITLGFSIDTAQRPQLSNAQLKELAGMVRQKEAIYIVKGCFAYDAGGATKHSTFCAFLDPTRGKDLEIKSWSFSACPEGNADY